MPWSSRRPTAGFSTASRSARPPRRWVLRDGEDREISIPLASIDTQRVAGSLMPPGLTDPLTRGELVDLIKFLSVLGKVGPYAAGKAPVARRWQVLSVPAELPLGRPEDADRLVADRSLTWTPAYSLVSGFLPVADIPALVAPRPYRLARFQVEVTTPGVVRLAVMPRGLTIRRVWVDAQRVEAKEVLDVTFRDGNSYDHVDDPR